MANELLSMPIHSLESISAATSVVPEPQKQSNTKSPLFDEVSIILCNRLRFFSVG